MVGYIHVQTRLTKCFIQRKPCNHQNAKKSFYI